MTMRSASSNITNITTTEGFINTTEGFINTTEGFGYSCTGKGPLFVSAVCCVLGGCVGFPASLWLLWVLVQRQRRGMTNDIYILNLTVMDVLFNIFVVPFMLNSIVWKNYVFMAVDNVLYSFNICGRPLFMACICVDCFMAVVYPITYMKVKRSRYRLLPCAAVWGFTLLFGSLVVYNRNLAISSFVGLPYVLSVPVIVACDLAILHTLRKPDPSGRGDVHPQKQRALQTITTSLVMTLVSYLPVLVVCPFLSLMSVSDEVKFCVIIVPITIAAMIGGVVMPLLQLHSLGSLRGLQQCTRGTGPSR